MKAPATATAEPATAELHAAAVAESAVGETGQQSARMQRNSAVAEGAASHWGRGVRVSIGTVCFG